MGLLLGDIILIIFTLLVVIGAVRYWYIDYKREKEYKKYIEIKERLGETNENKKIKN